MQVVLAAIRTKAEITQGPKRARIALTKLVSPAKKTVTLKLNKDTKVEGYGTESAQAFIKTMLTILLLVNDYEDKHKLEDMQKHVSSWRAQALTFAKRFGLTKQLTAILNTFLLKGHVFLEEFVDLAQAIRQHKPEMNQDTENLHGDHLKFITAIQTMCLKGGQTKDKSLDPKTRLRLARTWARMANTIFRLNDPEFSQFFEPDVAVSNVSSAIKTRTALAKKYKLSSNWPALVEMLAIPDEEDRAKFNLAGKALRIAYKQALTKIVRASGKHLIDAQTARTQLLAAGVSNPIQENFMGKLDEQGNYYTSADKRLKTIPSGPIIPNPNYDPQQDNGYVLKSKSSDPKNPNSIYTTDWSKDKAQAKASKVQDFIAHEASHTAMWRRDLMNTKKEDLTTILAATTEMLYRLAARVGNPGGKTDDENTYGLTTMHMAGVSWPSGGMKLAFRGKSGVDNVYMLKPTDEYAKRVISLMKTLTYGRAKDELFLSWQGKPIRSRAVSNYVKSKGIKLTPKDFRTILGTKIALPLIDKGIAQFKKAKGYSLKEAEKWFKEEMKAVGSALNHKTGNKETTSTTAINAYIDIFLINKFFTELGFGKRLPKYAVLR